MKRIGLIGAAAVAFVMAGDIASALPQQEQQQEDQNRKQGKHDKQDKDKREKWKSDKAKEQQGRQQEQAQQQQAQQEQIQRLQAQQQQAQQVQAQQVQAQQQQARQQQQVRQQQQQAQQRIALQQQRTAEYQRTIEEQLRLAQTHNAELERQNRTSQYRLQQQYAQSLRQQQLQVRGDRNYDYGRDPYFNTPLNYRYKSGNQYRQTNQYGVDVLRQAVNYGYQEGFRSGEADRLDRWRYRYQDAFAYRDANYGYTGRYVDQRDYNNYFRQGFRKGYDDGYYERARYGRQSNGSFTVLRAVLSGILNLELIR